MEDKEIICIPEGANVEYSPIIDNPEASKLLAQLEDFREKLYEASQETRKIYKNQLVSLLKEFADN